MKLSSIVFAAAALAVATAVGLAGDAPKPTASLTPHPHFNDGGTLLWSKKVADAQAAAKAGDKLIFIEYGREA